MTILYSGQLEDLVEKYDLRYDLLMEQEAEGPEDDYIVTVQKILEEMD